MRCLLVDKLSDWPFLRKMIFIKFEQWGMGLGMFGWSRRLRLLNLRLIYEIMKIYEKILSTSSTGNLSAATTCLMILDDA